VHALGGSCVSGLHVSTVHAEETGQCFGNVGAWAALVVLCWSNCRAEVALCMLYMQCISADVLSGSVSVLRRLLLQRAERFSASLIVWLQKLLGLAHHGTV
jgi:hypothetical protein